MLTQTGSPALCPVAASARLRGVAVLYLVTVFFFLLPPTAQAAPPKNFVSQPPSMITRSGDIVVALGLSVDSIEGLQLMLKDGAIMELSIQARLERIRSLWTNVQLSDATFTSTIRHHPLTREFFLTMPGEEKPIVDKSLPRLLAATWQKLKLPLGPVSLLQQTDPDSPYRITLDIRLRHTEVPPWLSNTYIFWSWNVVEPLTITMPFSF